MDIKNILNDRKCFKLVCGAGNEDAEQVRRLVYIYALAGAHIFDLSANEEVIMAAQESLHRANCDGKLCVSVGIAGDPHVSKAFIDKTKCVQCKACHSVCPQNAIDNANIASRRCIGCHRCETVCRYGAIQFSSQTKSVGDILRPLSKYNISIYELHAIGDDDDNVQNDWAAVSDMRSELKSLCIDRSKLGNERLINRIKSCISGREHNSTIVQADGTPMSGGTDDYRTTLQAVATAELVSKYGISAYILLSGGTNSHSYELASMIGVPINGVAIGSFARKIIRDQIECEQFWESPDMIRAATERACTLVRTVTFAGGKND